MPVERYLKRLGLILLAVIALAAVWMFGPALLPPKPVEAGIATGARVPVEMPLRDARGADTTLAAQMGEKGMTLFLVRSADWCPFCKAQLVRTQDIAAGAMAKGYPIVGLSYDEPGKLATFAADEGIGYALVSDRGSKMIDALGLRDPQYEEGSYAWGVPRASILVLGTDGTVKAKYVAADYRSRPSNEDVVAMIDGVKE
jgi:peroxiredoxin